MAVVHPKINAKSGFALIVVLSGLAILTAIFAISSNRAHSRLQAVRTDELILRNQFLRQELLRYVLQFDRADLTAQENSLPDLEISGTIYRILLQDVGGLIDLNTATPKLIQMLTDALELPDSAYHDYTAWRQAPNSLNRVTDFLSIVRADHSKREWLLSVATVHSGRSGLSPTDAPAEMQDIFHRGNLPINQFQTSASRVNFNIYVMEKEMVEPWLLGTTHFGPQADLNRLLWVNS